MVRMRAPLSRRSTRTSAFTYSPSAASDDATLPLSYAAITASGLFCLFSARRYAVPEPWDAAAARGLKGGIYQQYRHQDCTYSTWDEGRSSAFSRNAVRDGGLWHGDSTGQGLVGAMQVLPRALQAPEHAGVRESPVCCSTNPASQRFTYLSSATMSSKNYMQRARRASDLTGPGLKPTGRCAHARHGQMPKLGGRLASCQQLMHAYPCAPRQRRTSPAEPAELSWRAPSKARRCSREFLRAKPPLAALLACPCAPAATWPAVIICFAAFARTCSRHKHHMKGCAPATGLVQVRWTVSGSGPRHIHCNGSVAAENGRQIRKTVQLVKSNN